MADLMAASMEPMRAVSMAASTGALTAALTVLM